MKPIAASALFPAILVALLTAGVALPAGAQTTPLMTGTGELSTLHRIDDNEDLLVLGGKRLDDLEDENIYNGAGEDIGDIEGFLADSTGKISAVILEIDEGFLGIGGDEVIVPLDRLAWNADQTKIVSTVSEDELHTYPRWHD